jgi:hypothetical protein
MSQKSPPQKDIEITLLFLNVRCYTSGNLKYSKTNSNTKRSNYKFVLPSIRVRMVQLTTEQQIFVVTFYVIEVLNYLDEGKL